MIAVALVLVPLLFTGCSMPQEQDGLETQPSQDAILRVENGLFPAVAEKGRLGRKANILDRMEHYGVPGLVVTVIQEGEIAWARAYGVTVAGGNQHVTSHTMFQAASIAKPVTAVGALVLEQDGSIGLDQDVNNWLKSWKIPESEFTRDRAVTLRGLLSHMSGFSGNDGVAEYVPGTAVPTLIQALNGEPPATTLPVRVAGPAGKFSYSGAGYTVLQQLLVDVSEKPFSQFMHETVFLPLEMNRSTFDQIPPIGDIANGHHAGGEPVFGGFRVYSGAAAAGLWTTASDLAKFALSIQKAMSGESESLLTQETVKQMLTPQLPDCSRCWGLGIELLGQGAATWFTHDGINVGFDSKLIAHSSAGHGAVVMTNASLSFGLIYEILDSIATEYDWPDYSVKGQTESVPIPTDALISIPGEYALEPDFPVTIVADNGRLYLQIPTQGLTELYASSATSFFITAIDWGPMTFVSDPSGKVTAMMIGHPGEASTHKRLQ